MSAIIENITLESEIAILSINQMKLLLLPVCGPKYANSSEVISISGLRWFPVVFSMDSIGFRGRSMFHRVGDH